jgi:hypothetical protein
MNVNDFIARFRSDLDDAELPYLWSDADIIRYLNSAIKEACERALLIEDGADYDACRLRTVAGHADYELHPSVIKVKRVAFRGRPLDETSIEAMDSRGTAWEAQSGEPSKFICSDRLIRLVPKPSTSEIITLIVYRTQLEEFNADPLQSGDDDLEIGSIYHERLLPWMYCLAYRKHDSEVFNKDKSLEYEATFERSFGVRPDANVQRKHRDRRPPLIQSAW